MAALQIIVIELQLFGVALQIFGFMFTNIQSVIPNLNYLFKEPPHTRGIASIAIMYSGVRGRRSISSTYSIKINKFNYISSTSSLSLLNKLLILEIVDKSCLRLYYAQILE